uniref:Uncharacterized protein n=1 Tax=Ditylenchus dipsaci TaxID=166011 RepID=A0A915DD89_9BILA
MKANLRKEMKILGIPEEVRGHLYSHIDVLQQASLMMEFIFAATALSQHWTGKYAADHSCTYFKELFKEAYQLEQEKRPFFRSPQNNLFVMPSFSARDKNTADLYEKLLQGGWTFLQLKEYKAAFHVIVL